MTAIHCFFSGGRDSAVACYIAYQVARRRGWIYKLVYIDTTVAIKQTREYVKRYAEWLGVELIIIRPKKTFEEYAAQHAMWPSLQPPKFRWCYFQLKLNPTINYLKENYKEGDIAVLGIKGTDSGFRQKRYTSVFFVRDYGRLKVRAWAPLLYADNYAVERLIKRFGIPRNQIWHTVGFSGECLCLAGAPLHEIAIILRDFPEERELLLNVDRIIQRNRKSKRPAAPPSVHQAGFSTLEEFYEKAVKLQTTLDEFIMPYTGKACQGSCML